MKRSLNHVRGFTLIELLVVIAIIGGLAAVLIGALRSNKSAALQNAQSTLANVLTSARIKALASGCRVRVLIHADTNNPNRFRRMLAVQQESRYLSDQWPSPSSTALLPDTILVLPHENATPAGLYADSTVWTKTYVPSSGSRALHSSALNGAPVYAAIQGATVEKWDVVQFTPNDTMSFSQGDIVLASAIARDPSEYSSSESPARAESPDLVRGVSVSTYGVIALINTRSGF